MEYRRKTKLIKILILLLILGGLIITFFSFYHFQKITQPTDKLKPFSKFASGKGISFTEYRGSKKIYSISIESFSIEKASLGPFAIGPLNVAHLEKVNVDLYLDSRDLSLNPIGSGDKGGEKEIFNFENPIFNIKKNLPIEAKKIKSIKIKDISLTLWGDDKRIFKISSDTATIDRKTGDLIFTGHALMDAGENGSIISHRIRLNRKTRLFRITDSYLLTKGNERRQGTGIETDYLMKQMKNL